MRISDWSSDVCSSDLFLDLDKALGADGQWLPFASQLVACYPGAFVEVSSSGAGLHIIGTGPAPAPAHRNKPTPDVATKLAPLELEFRSEEHTSQLQSLMRITSAVFCLNKHTHTITYSNCKPNLILSHYS